MSSLTADVEDGERVRSDAFLNYHGFFLRKKDPVDKNCTSVQKLNTVYLIFLKREKLENAIDIFYSSFIELKILFDCYIRNCYIT